MRRNDDTIISVIGVGLFLVAAVGVSLYMFWQYSVEARLTDKTWSRTIEVERWQENTHEGWSVPPGGVVVSIERRKSGEDRYKCGTDLDGDDRYCTRNRYSDWYVYRIWEWTYNRSFVASGSYQQPPVWPETPGVGVNTPINPERLGKRYEVYHVAFIAKGGRVLQADIPQTEWDGLNVEQTYIIETNNVSMILKIKEK